jgi:hypothetical protein
MDEFLTAIESHKDTFTWIVLCTYVLIMALGDLFKKVKGKE